MLYRFDEFVLDTKTRELRRGSTCVGVEPQVFDLLEFLIRTRDRVASRDDLLEAVWQGRIVSESTLSSRINAARAAIGDDGTAQRLIRTLPRKGIRFLGTVREEREMQAEAGAPATAAAGQPIIPTSEGPSIAVLPFTNMSGDRETDYFADGMAEEIITALARCRGILVIARNSSFTYKGRTVDVRQVGRELGVSYVLEGSVRRSADRLRITAQLIETTGASHLWADRFDGSLSEVFDLQDRIAESAAAVIEPTMRFAEVERARRKPPENLDAYDLWLRALSEANQFTPESMAAALRYLGQALAINPSYALAMASAAYYHAQCQFQGWEQQPQEIRAKTVRLAWDAIELARDDSDVLWQAAFAIWTLDRDGPRARELFRRSLLINPNSAIALTLAGWLEALCDNPEAGRKMIERALRLTPHNPRGWFTSTGMAIACLVDGKYDEAISWAEKALVQNRRFAVALRALVVALVKAGQIERARQMVKELLRIDPQLSISRLATRLPFISQVYVDNLIAALREAGLPE